LILYVIDGSNDERLKESKQVLEEIKKHKDLKDVDYVYVISKCDKEDCKTAEEISHFFKFENEKIFLVSSFEG
jgi:GTPase involved in cell partitioning and DNA repair